MRRGHHRLRPPGRLVGSDLLGFDADIVTFAKGITSGQAPLGGMLFTDDVAAPLLDGGALYAHGFTFGGHPLACAVALANLAIMRREGVVENVQQLESHLDGLLAGVADGSDLVVEARGRGFFRAIELRDASLLPAARDAIRRNGVIVRLDDRVNPCLAISPPLISMAPWSSTGWRPGSRRVWPNPPADLMGLRERQHQKLHDRAGGILAARAPPGETIRGVTFLPASARWASPG